MTFFSLIILGVHLLVQIQNWTIVQSLSSGSSSSSSFSFSTIPTTFLSRSQAATVVNEIILPSNEYNHRMTLGRQAQGIGVFGDDDNNPNNVIMAQDQRLYQTYGEFPFHSLDMLLDRALSLQNQQPTNDNDNNNKNKLTCIDLGSGCGRLVYYLGLSRPNWSIHGIELSPLLHQEAIRAQERAITQGVLLQQHSSDVLEYTNSSLKTILSFHQGSAEQMGTLLQSANIVFAYSTAWECQGYSSETQTMILSEQWNQIITQYCGSQNTIVITTDRSLDPKWGWTILDRMEIPNPEVMGSIGYIQKFVKDINPMLS